jgi:hypothetical protein
MTIRYQWRSEMVGEYAVDPLDIVGKRRPGVSWRCDGDRAGRGAAGAGPGEHRSVAGITPSKQDLSKIKAWHLHIRWREMNKYLGAYMVRSAKSL